LGPMVVLGRMAVSYERGTPVHQINVGRGVTHARPFEGVFQTSMSQHFQGFCAKSEHMAPKTIPNPPERFLGYPPTGPGVECVLLRGKLQGLVRERGVRERREGGEVGRGCERLAREVCERGGRERVEGHRAHLSPSDNQRQSSRSSHAR